MNPTAINHQNHTAVLINRPDRRAGVKSYNVDLKGQTANVEAEESLSYEKVLETIKKTGKKVNSGEADGEEKSVEL